MDRAKLERLLGGERWKSLREHLMVKAQRHADPSTPFTLARLRPEELALICGLLGRPVPASGSLRLTIGALDAALADCGAAPSLRTALEALDGPWQDPRVERQRQQAEWDAVFAAVEYAALAQSLASTAARGSLKAQSRQGPAQVSDWLQKAQRVLRRLPLKGRSLTLAQLAAETTGNAHGLDRGSVVARLVLNALLPAPADGDAEESQRARWERLGVQAGELNRPVLVLNLACIGDGLLPLLVNAARAAGEPLHLSMRLLARQQPQWCVKNIPVFVCENPSVLAMAARQLGARSAPLVCTEGYPAAAQRLLLTQLRDAGALLHYHGDFDWDGIRIANGVMAEFGAEPWRMAAADYSPYAGLSLSGPAVAACWDDQLGATMQARGLAQHEEAVIECLLDDLK